MSSSDDRTDVPVDQEDGPGLQDLLAEHYPAIYRTVLHLVQDSNVANDLKQSSFLAALRGRRGFRGNGSVRSWLLAIAVNEVRQYKRRTRRRAERPIGGAEVDVVDPGGDAADAAIRREFELALACELARIPDELQEPIVLRYFENLSLSEIARVLMLPKSTVQARLERAIERLRNAFRRSHCLAVLPLLDRLAPGPTVPLATLATGATMSKPKILAVGVVAIALAALSPFAWNRIAAPDDPPSALGPDLAALGPDRAARTTADSGMPAVPATRLVRDELEAASATTGASVHGIVIDGRTRAPVPGVRLSLYDYERDAVIATRSDGTGRFHFPDTAGRHGVFHLVADGASHGRVALPDVEPSTAPLLVTMDDSLEIAGRVVRANDGRPVNRFAVHAVPLPFQAGQTFDEIRALHRQAIPHGLRVAREVSATDGEGRFRVPGLGPGRYVLLVVAEGAPPVLFNGGGESRDHEHGVEAKPRGTGAEHVIGIPPTTAGHIRVIDAQTGEPVHGVSILLVEDVHRTRFSFPFGTVPSSMDGRYEFPWFVDSRGRIRSFDIEVHRSGYAPWHGRGGGQEIGHELVAALRRPATVHGVVRDADGRIRPGTAILAERCSDCALIGSTVAAADGSYELRDLPPGVPMTLRALDRTRRNVVGVAALELDDRESRRLDFGAGAGIRGRLRVNGEPRRGARVRLVLPDGRSFVDCDPGDDGVFAFDDLSPGRHELVLVTNASGRDVRRLQILELRPGEQRHLDLDFAPSLRGVLVDADTGRAPTGEEPIRLRVVPREAGGDGIVATTSADPNGGFELWLAETGRVTVSLEPNDEWVAIAPCEVDVGSGADRELELRVRRDPQVGRIAIRIVDAATGERIPSGSFRFLTPEAASVGAFEDGSLVLERLAAGRYRVTASTDEHAPATVEATIAPGDQDVLLTLALPRARFVRVRAIEPGEPAALAGIEPGDLLLRVGDDDIRSRADLQRAEASMTAEAATVIRVQRGGTLSDLSVRADRLRITVENLATD